MTADYPDWQRGIRLIGSDITLNVNIEATVVTLDINFLDQSVAVWGASAWFARMGDQVFASGTASEVEGQWKTVLTYTVPADKTFYACGVSYSVLGGDGTVYSCHLRLYLEATIAFRLGDVVGHAIPLDVPISAEAGETFTLSIEYWAVSGSATMTGSLWGYLEDVEEE